MKLWRGSVSVCVAALCLMALGCEKKMEPKECDSLRAKAFEHINIGQQCEKDPDCQQSEWPGCEKPISVVTAGKIKALHDQYTAGKCEEPKAQACRTPPEVYCKQGLCVHREIGTPEGGSGTPTGDIIIK